MSDSQKDFENAINAIQKANRERIKAANFDDIFSPEKIQELKSAVAYIWETLRNKIEEAFSEIDVEWILFLTSKECGKIKHLAFNHKKIRVRKKNVSRLHQEYKKMQRETESHHSFLEKNICLPEGADE